MLAYCVKGGQQRDAEEHLSVYLDALEEELLAPLTSSSAHKPTFAAPGIEIEERKEGSQSGEGQTGMGKRDYIVRQSFSQCSEPSVVDVCADTIKSPISRIFDGKFRITCQDDTVTVESWRTLQLDIQVCSFTLFLSPSARLEAPVTDLQTLPTA